MSEHPRPETIALHGGQEPDSATNARAVPIYQTTSYVFDDTQHAADLFALAVPGNIYTRIMNPTWAVLEERLAALEGGIGGLVTASGQAAVTYSVLNVARAGDNIISVSQLYGGTYNLFAHTLPQYGIEVRWADADDPGAVARLADERTRLVFGETVGNPKLNVLDVPAWAEAAHAAGVPLILDNTVPTPIGARVFEQGADVAVHSLTKYIGGHGTSIGGAIVDAGSFDWVAHAERFPGLTQPDPSYHGVVWSDALGPAAYIGRARTVLLRNTGAALSPFNAFLFLQGVETLPLRMERHNANGLAVAEHLSRARGGRLGLLPGPRLEPLPRGRRPRAARRLRRARHVRRARRRRGRQGVHREPQAVQPSGEHRGRQVAGDPQRLDDALPAQRRGARRGGGHPGDRAPVGGHRAHRRHRRGPRPGSGRNADLSSRHDRRRHRPRADAAGAAVR